MLLTVTSKRQVTFPAHVLASLGAKPGGRIELTPSPQGYILRAKTVDSSRLAPLRGTLGGTLGVSPAPFDIQSFRAKAHDPALRD